MSGESVFSFSKKQKPSAMEERLGVESDRRLFGCMGTGSICGMALAAYALTIDVGAYLDKFTPPEIARPTDPHPSRPDPKVTVIIPENYHKKKPAYAKHTPKPGTPGSHARKPSTPKPSEKPGSLALSVITAKRGDAALTAYNLISKALRETDLDKLTEYQTLKRTGQTTIGGRRGKESHEFNVEYNEAGTGGGGLGIEIPGLADNRIVNETRNSKLAATSVEIDKFENTTTRSTASILAVIRSHSPGLRHVYNSFLKLRPGLAGKLTLRFAIAPSGQVVDVGLAGSTTSAPEFDAQVIQKVMAWRFEPVKAVGNDMVTVPFNFSE
jgi:TonB family protein